MFQTFTGSSRKRPQVNLSGRNSNPFANNVVVGQGSHNALAAAQQDRITRQKERERVQAATLVQKRWRGNIVRRSVKDGQRRRWDDFEAIEDIHADSNDDAPPYDSEGVALSQLWLLLRFINPVDRDDFARLRRYYQRLLKTSTVDHKSCTGGPWPSAYLRLEGTCLDAMQRSKDFSSEDQSLLFDILRLLVTLIPKEIAQNSAQYYEAIASVLPRVHVDLETIVAPLQSISSSTLLAYQSFALKLLTTVNLGDLLTGDNALESLAENVNCKLLGNAVARLFSGTPEDTSGDEPQPITLKDTSISNDKLSIGAKSSESWLALLGHIIYIYRHAHGFRHPERFGADQDFLFVISTLLTYVGDDLEIEPLGSDIEVDVDEKRSKRTVTSADRFVYDQVLSLVNQDSITGLLNHINSQPDTPYSIDEIERRPVDRTMVLANYILTLIRIVPRRADEIRMWLYLGLSAARSESSHNLPVFRVFWSAAQKTSVYEAISSDPRTAINLLKARVDHSRSNTNQQWQAPTPMRDIPTDIDNEWRVILLFTELYTFALKVMDDEEFFSTGQDVVLGGGLSRSTLPLDDVQSLVTFLKHLGFTMYFNAADIANTNEKEEQRSLSSLFRVTDESMTQTESEKTPKRQPSPHIAGLHGMTLDYVKGLVTGLLRAIYERDSRRSFLPKGHWLMTSRFDMTNFIDAVIEEEERRNKVQEEEDEEDLDSHTEDYRQPATLNTEPRLVGMGRAQRQLRIENLQRQQRKLSRQRYLQAVAPRLEILQNMPFLIPFTTRVQIFRRFVHMDQLKRREGVVDPEFWRHIQRHGPESSRDNLQRHHATIRREHEFEDAFEQFFDLGQSLKEPIQITFMDQFDTEEAGIDGGGVTKEFLTSVTNQAFAPSEGIDMFAENDQHLLYPNPTAIEQRKEALRMTGLLDTDPAFNGLVQDLLRRYEFLGRIIGKCLYEGILIDIGFAGFFLLKWALTGGTGSAPRESGYRANLNDLREFDEGLYQGLLKLKNYPGDVEDFSLNFTVTDTIPLPTSDPSRPHSRAITKDLKPSGSLIPVTNANRLVYISYIARHRLQSQPAVQTTAFLRGLSSIILPSWLSMFNQSELQTLVGGAASSISVPDLRANTVYGGVYTIGDDGREHPSVELFWAVMEELDDDERRKVLKFVTSTPRAPLLGFASLNPKFSIRDAGDDESRLPSTSTCVNLLKLPRYSAKAVCKGKLLQAVNSGAGFDLS